MLPLALLETNTAVVLLQANCDDDVDVCCETKSLTINQREERSKGMERIEWGPFIYPGFICRYKYVE